MSKLADIGRAENQPISAEVREFLDDEIAQLQKRINELEEQAESSKMRLANQETTIRVQAETIARLEERDINRLMETNEPPLPPKTANVPGEPVGVHTAPNVRRAGGK